MSGILEAMGAGTPLPVVLSAMDDARWWAGVSTPVELKAYALAAFEAMRPKVKRDFLAYISGQVAQ